MQAGALPDIRQALGAYFWGAPPGWPPCLHPEGEISDHMMDHDSVAINFLPPSVPPDKISSNRGHCGSITA